MAASFVVRTSINSCAITCQHCAAHIAISTTRLQQHRAPTNLVCEDCGHTFQIVRDERRFPRMTLCLEGMLLEVSTHAPLASLTITDLSLSGLRCRMIDHPHLQVGALYTIVFRLNDAIQSKIQEDIVVRQLYDAQTVGAEFHPPDHYNFDLDFYLNSWVVAYK